MSYEQQAGQNKSWQTLGAGAANSPQIRDTLQARLEVISSVLNDCETVLAEVGMKFTGPVPSSQASKDAPQASVIGLALEISNKAQRLREGLQALTLTIA